MSNLSEYFLEDEYREIEYYYSMNYTENYGSYVLVKTLQGLVNDYRYCTLDNIPYRLGTGQLTAMHVGADREPIIAHIKDVLDCLRKIRAGE